jgi:myo-inositol-1(or 4)-monophosphatase
MDPLDGSLNYTLGIPAVSVSLVFYDVSKPYLIEPLAGAVANVFLREIISFDDRNVYINRVKVSGYKPSKSGIAVIYTWNPEIFPIIHKFMKGTFEYPTRLRVLGSAALESVYAGLGRIDLFFHNTGRLRNLDVAGGIGVAKRLGAQVFDLEDKLNSYRADRIEFLKSLVIGEPRIIAIKEYIPRGSS